MGEHYTKNTVEVQKHCGTCGRATMHRVYDGRVAHCLSHGPKRASVSTPVADAQQSLFSEGEKRYGKS